MGVPATRSVAGFMHHPTRQNVPPLASLPPFGLRRRDGCFVPGGMIDACR